MERIAAGIVTYNPNIEVLKKNYSQYIEDVEKIYVYDNASINVSEIEKEVLKNPKIKLIKSNENKGIAYALNQIMKEAQKEGVQWILTMDQDSICQDNILKKLRFFCSAQNAIIHPYVIEVNGTRQKKDNIDKNQNVDFCITSSSLTNVKAWEKVGGYDEWMFIDMVDFEFCAKLREYNYDILQLNNVFLYQEVGKLKEIIIGKRHIYVRNHSAIRKYYFIRNLMYCRYCHPKTFGLKIVLDFFVSSYMKVLLFEKEKIEKLKAMNKGIKDGVKKIRELEKKKG